MKKQKIQIPVDYNLDWNFSVDLNKIKNDILELEKLGATHIEITSSVSYDCAEIEIQAFVERQETEEEYQKRTF